MRKMFLFAAVLSMLVLGGFGNPLVASSNKTLHIDIDPQYFNPLVPPFGFGVFELPAPDNRIILRANGSMSVSGDLEGILIENITQVIDLNHLKLRRSNVLWKMEIPVNPEDLTEGLIVMEGYYSGFLKDIGEIGEESRIRVKGQVLSVTYPELCTACYQYADYLNAKVEAQVLLNLDSFWIEGKITIRPRNRR